MIESITSLWAELQSLKAHNENLIKAQEEYNQIDVSILWSIIDIHQEGLVRIQS